MRDAGRVLPLVTGDLPLLFQRVPQCLAPLLCIAAAALARTQRDAERGDLRRFVFAG